MAIKNTVKKIVDKTKDVASTIIADVAFGGAKAKKKIREANRQAEDAKMVRDFKGKPDSGDYTDPLFRARINNLHDRADAEAKAKKLETARKVQTNPGDYEADYSKMRSGKKSRF